MINRGMAIRRTAGAFPPLDVPPCQPYQDYPVYPGHWSSYPPHQSQRFLGYGGPYLGYASDASPPPPGQVKQDLGSF